MLSSQGRAHRRYECEIFVLRDTKRRPQYVAASGGNKTERKRLEAEIVAGKEMAGAATKAKSTSSQT